MEAILQYAYLQQARLTPDNIESVMFTADRLNVLGLLKQCTDFLATHLSHENAVGILKIARHLHCRSLPHCHFRSLCVTASLQVTGPHCSSLALTVIAGHWLSLFLGDDDDDDDDGKGGGNKSKLIKY